MSFLFHSDRKLSIVFKNRFFYGIRKCYKVTLLCQDFFFFFFYSCNFA